MPVALSGASGEGGEDSGEYHTFCHDGPLFKKN
jgi:diphthamide synthase (EF-2-diphthine--ammonia ligase)